MRSAHSRPLYWAVWFLVVLAVIGRLLLPLFLKKKINQTLSRLPDYTGRVEGVHLAIWRGGLSLRDVTFKHRERDFSLAIKQVSVSLRWFYLLHGEVVANLSVESPRIRMLVKRPTEAVKKTQEKGREVNEAVKEKTGESLPDVLAGLVPFRIDSFMLTDGSIRLRDQKENIDEEAQKDIAKKKESGEGQDKEPGLEARVTHIEIAVRNLTNRRAGEGSAMATGQASAQIMNDGHIELDLRLDPTAHVPKFYMGIQITHLDLTALNPILRWQWGIDAKRGIFELFSEAAAADGRFKGYVKPLIRDLKMVDLDKDKGAVKIIKEAVVGAVAAVFKNSEKDQVGTKVPFEGQFENPKAGIWEAILEVLRNAFIEALKPKLDRTVKLRDVAHPALSK